LTFVDQGNLLITLCLLDCVMSSARHIETFFEKLKTKFCFTLLIIFDSD
jgi:hypothetical protein